MEQSGDPWDKVQYVYIGLDQPLSIQPWLESFMF